MKGLLLVGGDGPDRETLLPFLQGVNLVIAADSGLDLALRLCLCPDLVVGDMDSVENRGYLDSLPPGRVRRFSHDKDETDTEIGLRLFFELGYSAVVLAGGGGGRLDHLLGLCALFERSSAPAVWITRHEHIQTISGDVEFTGWKGQTVSFFLLGDANGFARSEGLKWSLDDFEFRRGHPGLSNLAVADRVRVRVEHGKLLMVRILPGGYRAQAE